MLQLAEDEAQRLPPGAEVIRRHTYVDDIFAGADDVTQADHLRQQITAIFAAGQFQLDKWAASDPRLVPRSRDEIVPLDDCDGVSTLGVVWHPKTDTLSLKVSLRESFSAPTKRSILSDIARLFDPLGWVSPVIITEKFYCRISG